MRYLLGDCDILGALCGPPLGAVEWPFSLRCPPALAIGVGVQQLGIGLVGGLLAGIGGARFF